jgi:hypothetical protein
VLYEFIVVPRDQICQVEVLDVFALIQEEEGATLIRPLSKTGPTDDGQENCFAHLVLGVHSSLHGVGLSATVSSALASEGISCNVVAGYYHDHLFVPCPDAKRALKVLQHLVTD